MLLLAPALPHAAVTRKLLHSERSLYREVLVYESGLGALHVLHAPLPRRPAIVHGPAPARSPGDELSADDARRAVRRARAAIHSRSSAWAAARCRARCSSCCRRRGSTSSRSIRRSCRSRDDISISRRRQRAASPRWTAASSCKRALREAAALRPHHARCVRSRIHSRASADAGVPDGSEGRCSRRAACWPPTRSRPAASTITSRRPMRRCSRSSSI